MTLRVGWFCTTGGENSRRLLAAAAAAIRSGELDAQFAFVFCSRERGEYETTDGFLDLVASLDIPCLTLSSRRFRRERGGTLSKPGESLPPWRAEYDRQVAELVSAQPFDVGMLAGYMLVFTAEMCNRYPLLNLHPAEPGGPVGTWQEVVWQLIDRRAERSGVMIHLATEELDRGPPVAYCTYPLRGPAFDPLWQALGSRSAREVRGAEGEEHDLFLEIRRHGVVRESPLVVATLRAFAQGRLRIERLRVVDASGGPLPGGLELTAEIDAAVAPMLRKS